MKKIIRLTESDLHRIVKNSVQRILKEDNVLGNDFMQDGGNEMDNNTSANNNYQSFKDQKDDLPFGLDDDFSPLFKNEHDWGTQGEENIDPTFYEDPDWYRDDVIGEKW